MILHEITQTKLNRILTGVAPNIYTIGIITAENPYNWEQPTPEAKLRQKKRFRNNNLISNDRLEKLIKTRYSYLKIKGKYANILENSFLVLNVRFNDLISWSKIFKQSAFIYGEKVDDDTNGKIYAMKFQYFEDVSKKGNYILGDEKYSVYNPIEKINAEISNARDKISKSNNNPLKGSDFVKLMSSKYPEQDNFSIYKTRAFKIPFFEIKSKIDISNDNYISLNENEFFQISDLSIKMKIVYLNELLKRYTDEDYNGLFGLGLEYKIKNSNQIITEYLNNNKINLLND